MARQPHPEDDRVRLIVFTDRGWACTRAADYAAADTVRAWVEALGEERVRALRDDLALVAPSGRLRPTW